jgi:hypothetical protein
MPMSRLRLLGLALAAAVAVAGCTGPVVRERFPPIPVPPLPLQRSGSCGELLDDLRTAAVAAAGPGTVSAADGDPPAPGGDQPDPLLDDSDPPDVLKAEGDRIVTVHDGVLRVVDAAYRRRIGALDLGARGLPAELLLLGSHALVLVDRGA